MCGEKVILKAPGKILIAGGYGVLEPLNFGLSLAVDRYFYSVSSCQSSGQASNQLQISIKSPQIGELWHYQYSYTDLKLLKVSGKQNDFIEKSLLFSLAFASEKIDPKITKINIIILQDRGFLSESSQSQKDVKFINYHQCCKTGLGSSAAVVVVIVGAILTLLRGEPSQIEINGVSQMANLSAQQKIGSNFDISTAVFGTHLYKNLLPRAAYEASQLKNFKKVLAINPQITFINASSEVLKNGYSCIIDLKAGSNTRKMVSGFIKALEKQHKNIIEEFYEKSKIFVNKIYNILSQSQGESLCQNLRAENKAYRQFLQYYSSLTGVPVEPPQFKPFLDDICDISNVIYTICPGSGGYDAIFILSKAQTRQEKLAVKKKIEEVLNRHNMRASIKDINIEWEHKKLTQEQKNEIVHYLA